MKTKIFGLVAAALGLTAMTACTDLDEKVYDRIDTSVFYQNEQSVQGAIASVYSQAANSFAENFFMLQELPADQVAWRCWNLGQWGYDEGEKTVLSMQIWSPESKIIRNAWEGSWTGIGLANQIVSDLGTLNPASLKMTQDGFDAYTAELRTLRAWNYYNLFEIWGGALPLNVEVTSDIPGSADPDFNVGCKKIYDFIMTELDESLDALPKEDGSRTTTNRMNQGVNRILKARLYLNAQIFIGEDHFAECEALCKEIMDGKYGNYAIADDYRDIFSLGNEKCPEVVFAFACEDGKGSTNAVCNMRNMPYLAYNYTDYFNCPSYDGIGAWNCFCLVPSLDNSVDLYANRYNLNDPGFQMPKSFLKDYGDKLGAPHDRMDDRDIRKQPFVYDEKTGKYQGQFLQGVIRSNYGKGDVLTADADRDGQDLAYFDQVGTFVDQSLLQVVNNSRWGETNSGLRYIKYPMFPTTDKGGFKDIDEVEFRLAEVVYMIAECELRAGHADAAKEWVDKVRRRYFTDLSALNVPGPGFDKFDLDWMLSQWGLEYLSEGRRRRTDLRRFDKFTQGQWWFFGRSEEGGVPLPAKRDRKYEWYPLPANAIGVNPGLVQNPNY